MKQENKKSEENNPPSWARKVFHLVCPDHLIEYLDGDLLEEYRHQLKVVGSRKATIDYVINALTFIRPFTKKRKHYDQTKTSFPVTMWRNYLTTAARNFSRHKTNTSLNLAGLTMGLISSMLIFQFVMFEKSADGFHAKRDQLYRVGLRSVSGGGTPETMAQIFLGAGEAFAADVPAVVDFTRIRADFFQEGPTISYTTAEEKVAFKDIRSIIVDSTFLRMFTFPLVQGDQRSFIAIWRSG